MASIPYSDTTVKNGHLQQMEFWTGLGDAGISGNATLKLIMTTRLNDAFDKIMPRLLRYLRFLGFDDTNQTGIPTKLTNIVNGTSTYTISTDTNSFEVLEILNVAILASATETQYTEIEKISADDVDAPFFLSPNTLTTGVPNRVLIIGNKLFFNCIPNYSATSGIKTFLVREQDRFAVADTTATAGIPLPFQSLLPVYAAHDWLVVNKPAETMLITRLEAEIARREKDLESFISARNQTRNVITTKWQGYA